MDGDLQDPPEAVPELLSYYRAGYDVVYARRVNRKESWWLRLCYYVFYRLIAALSSTPLPLDAGDFGLLSRRVVDEIRRMPEHHRYLRGMRMWVGFRQIGVAVERSARHAGRTKYSPIKLLKLASDGIFCFFHRALARGCYSRSLRNSTIFRLFALCLICEVLVAFAGRLHCPDLSDDILIGNKFVLPGNYR